MQAGEEAYDPQYHTKEMATEHAEAIYKNGQGKWFGTDEKSIFKILCAAPPQHIQAISDVYADKYGYTLFKAMEKELTGNVRDATVYLLGMKMKPFETIAKLIKTACAGLGTDELLLTCCIVRYQMVMKVRLDSTAKEGGKVMRLMKASSTRPVPIYYKVSHFGFRLLSCCRMSWLLILNCLAKASMTA
jgi:hypothetical protein